jgi:hypothetical protein
VQIKGGFTHTSELGESSFCITPKAFDSVDMRFTLNELISAMLNPKMFFVSQVNQAVVATPVIGMDNAIRTHTASDNCLKGLASTVRNNFRVDFTIALENAKYNGFTTRPAASSAFEAAGTEIGLVNLNFARKG